MHNCRWCDMNWNLGKYDQDVVHVKQRQLHSYLEPGKCVCYKNPIHIYVFYKTLLHIQKLCVLDTVSYIFICKIIHKIFSSLDLFEMIYFLWTNGKKMGAYAIFRKFLRPKVEAGQPLLELSLTKHFKQNFTQPANPPQHQLIWEAWCL